MEAFHNDPKVKKTLLTQLRNHAAADEIVQGEYWGRAVGCTAHSGDYDLYESIYGIPRILPILEALIFEALPNAEAKTFPVEFIEAIPVGADLSLVWPKFAVWLMRDLMRDLKTLDESKVCEQIALLYSRRIEGDEPAQDEWVKARSYAADDYADAAFAADAYTYADDEADAVVYAAYAYAEVIDADAAYGRQKKKLIELLREAV